MPSKLTQQARDDIQLQLEAETHVDVIVSSYRISSAQVYKMRDNLRAFGTVAPDPAQFQVQGRPRLVTPEAREGVLDFLLENGKLAYIDEVRFFLEEEYGIVVGWETARRLVKSLEMTKKVVSYKPACSRAPLTNILAYRWSERCSNEMRVYACAGRPNSPSGKPIN